MPTTQARVLATGPFVLAIAAAAALVLAAPFVGQIRSAVRVAFPGQYLFILTGVAALGLLAALASAVYRIRDRRLVRFGLIAIAIFVAVAYSLWNTTPSAERNAVERFHFLQYGLIAFLFYRAWRPLQDAGVIVLPVLAGLIVSAAEEWLQWFIPNRVGEINDVLLNLVAIVCGLIFSLGIEPPKELRLAVSADTRRRIARLAIAAVGAVAIFLHIVHLGHVVKDGEIGEFTTRFSPERLAALQKERAARWAVAPPPRTLVRLSREDQYLTEGMEHVRERNELWEDGNIRGAWLENRILEKYYAPVLRTPTHEGAGHAWPDAQRADAEARAATADRTGFSSSAYPYRILPWSKPLFWTVVALLAGWLAWIGGVVNGGARHTAATAVGPRDNLR